MSSVDDIESNSSTFHTEVSLELYELVSQPPSVHRRPPTGLVTHYQMKEVAHILKNVGDRSLVLIDELGRR